MARDRAAVRRGLSPGSYKPSGGAVSHDELMRRKRERYADRVAAAGRGDLGAARWLARKREVQREGSVDRRRAAGVGPRKLVDDRARGYGGVRRDWDERKVLDARILVAWVGLHGGDVMVAARLGDCDEREIYRKARASGRITVSGADRVLLELGYGWAMDQLYPPGE